MESKVDYTVVGLFVLLFSTAVVAFAFWLGKYNDDERAYHRYTVYMTESVAGLAPEAAVKFRGVDVGMVESIQINPKNSEEVELILKIKKETPIKIDSYAILKFYGITGLAYIEIAGGTDSAPLRPTDNEAMGVIPSSPSLIKRLDESLSNVAAKLSITLDKADRVFSDRNVDNVTVTLANLRSLTAQIDSYHEEIKRVLEKSAALEENASRSMEAVTGAAQSAKRSSDNFNTLITTKMSSTLESLEATSRESRSLVQKIEKSMERGDYDIHSIASPTAAELNELIEQSKNLTIEMEQTLKSLRESPSDLLFKKSKPKPGPGE